MVCTFSFSYKVVSVAVCHVYMLYEFLWMNPSPIPLANSNSWQFLKTKFWQIRLISLSLFSFPGFLVKLNIIMHAYSACIRGRALVMCVPQPAHGGQRTFSGVSFVLQEASRNWSQLIRLSSGVFTLPAISLALWFVFESSSDWPEIHLIDLAGLELSETLPS